MSQPNPAPSSSSTTQPGVQPNQLVLQREQQFADALRRYDLPLWEKLVADDWSMVNLLGQVISRDEMFNALTTRDMRIQSFDYQDLQTRILGDTAIVTGIVNFRGLYQGQDISGPYRFTHCWARREDQWQLVAAQYTRIQQAEATKYH